jgi:hypothetical protein
VEKHCCRSRIARSSNQNGDASKWNSILQIQAQGGIGKTRRDKDVNRTEKGHRD